MKLILLGAPGAGKGTQAENISGHYKIPTISTGNMIRAAIHNGTELGKQAESLINAGKLVSDEIVIGMIRERLAEADCKSGFILDGFPRTVAQAKAFDEKMSIDVALNIDADDDALVARIAGRRMCSCGATYHVDWLDGKTTCEKCGAELYQRDDDKEETVYKRLQVYKEQTAPLAAHYDAQGVLKSVDGMQDVDAVYAQIKVILDGIA